MKSKKAKVVAMVVGSWIALVSSRASADTPHEAASPEIAFLWCDAHQLFSFSEKVAKEVKSTFSEMGVMVQWWENEEEFSSHPSTVQLMVIMLPSEPGGRGWNINPNAMGAVVHVENEPIEFLYIFFPNVMRGIGLNPRSGRTLEPRSRRDLGRALGRIIAHEAIHAVIPSLSHAEEGILNDQLKGSFLQKQKALLDAHSQEVLLSELMKKASREAEAETVDRTSDPSTSSLAADPTSR